MSGKNNFFGKCLLSFKKVFSEGVYKVLGFSLFLNFLIIDYLILTQVSTFRVLFDQNIALFVYSGIVLSVLVAFLASILLTFSVYLFSKKLNNSLTAGAGSFGGSFFSFLATGCPVCGAWLLALLGITPALANFPFQGLELKIFALIILILSLKMTSDSVLGICDSKKARINLFFILGLILIFFISLFWLKSESLFKFQKDGIEAGKEIKVSDNQDNIYDKLYDQVNPKKGYEINVKFNNLGYRLVKMGAIDFDEFKSLYERSGQPLTEEQLKIFTEEGLDKNIVINRENSYFLLNLFWAFGLTNKNPIILEGPVDKYRDSLASTAGWTIATKPLNEFMGKMEYVVLTDEQQKLLKKVADNVFRPCCSNPTSFPDCNHGMALLGVLELMVASGATEEEMYEAAKYFSAYWFPNQMMDVALYFLMFEDTDFENIDSKIVVSERFFSATGWSGLKRWLEEQMGGNNNQIPSGGGCGVESGAPATRQQNSGNLENKRIVPAGGGGCGV